MNNLKVSLSQNMTSSCLIHARKLISLCFKMDAKAFSKLSSNSIYLSIYFIQSVCQRSSRFLSFIVLYTIQCTGLHHLIPATRKLADRIGQKTSHQVVGLFVGRRPFDQDSCRVNGSFFSLIFIQY